MPVHDLLSTKERLQVAHIDDKLAHSWNAPALLLIGVDTRRLADAFILHIDSISPLSVDIYNIENPAGASPLKNAKQLEPMFLQVFNFFDCRGISLDEVAANLIFYRDYIPQYKLKVIILASHELLNTIIEKAYDFYSIAGFTGFFNDFKEEIDRHIRPSGSVHPLALQYRKEKEELSTYRKQAEVVPGILLKKTYNFARTAYNVSKQTEAFSLFKEAMALAEDLNKTDVQASILNFLGSIVFENGETAEGLRHFQQAGELAEKTGSVANRAYASINTGSVYFRRGQLADALKCWERAAALAQKIGDAEMEAVAYNHIGTVFKRKGENAKALDCFNRALAGAQAHHLPDTQAASLSKIGDIHLFRGETDKASAYFEDALRLNQANANAYGEASVLDKIADLHALAGEYPAAFSYCQRALTIARSLENLKLQATILTHIGQLNFKTDDLDEAIKFHQEARDIAKKIDNLQLLALVNGNLGNTYIEKDDRFFKEALECFENAFDAATQSGDNEEITKQYLNLSYYYRQHNKWKKSREYLYKALELAMMTDNCRLEAQVHHNMGLVAVGKKKQKEALEHFHLALATYKRIGNRDGEVGVLLSIGAFWHSRGEYEEAAKNHNL
ncbi:MAG: tetratricopeptide repeat protein, partial [bacterium]|nr:tetratricopeptide repeat protein [bacterium]